MRLQAKCFALPNARSASAPSSSQCFNSGLPSPLPSSPSLPASSFPSPGSRRGRRNGLQPSAGVLDRPGLTSQPLSSPLPCPQHASLLFPIQGMQAVALSPGDHDECPPPRAALGERLSWPHAWASLALLHSAPSHPPPNGILTLHLQTFAPNLPSRLQAASLLVLLPAFCL